jgi:hypothetical protein
MHDIRDASKENLAEKSVPQKLKIQPKVSQETLLEGMLDSITESFKSRSRASSKPRFKATGFKYAALRRSSALHSSLM